MPSKVPGDTGKPTSDENFIGDPEDALKTPVNKTSTSHNDKSTSNVNNDVAPCLLSLTTPQRSGTTKRKRFSYKTHDDSSSTSSRRKSPRRTPPKHNDLKCPPLVTNSIRTTNTSVATPFSVTAWRAENVNISNTLDLGTIRNSARHKHKGDEIQRDVSSQHSMYNVHYRQHKSPNPSIKSPLFQYL